MVSDGSMCVKTLHTGSGASGLECTLEYTKKL
jgi:hypothetical protein